MSESGKGRTSAAALRRLAALGASLLLASACSSGDGDPAPMSNAPPPVTGAQTGTIGVLLTDAPTDLFSAINLTVTEIVLLGGGDDDDGQQVLFNGSKEVDLLDLANFSEPVSFAEVQVGSYNKLRMYISDLELVPHEGPPLYPALPANGKIDLLDQDGFDILPEQTLLAEIDIDANKSIKVTGTGNGGYKFRPVVKVQFSLDGDLPDNLARVEGLVDSISDDDSGRFTLCAIDNADNCLDVDTGEGTSLFGPDGMPTTFEAMEIGQNAVVIGRYVNEATEDDADDELDIDVELAAIVVELGGNSSQLFGRAVTAPVDGEFLMLEAGDEESSGSELTVELQDGTRVFDNTTEVDASAIVVGSGIDIEGVLVTAEGETEPSSLLAALMFVMPPELDTLSGEVAVDSVDTEASTFDLSNEAGITCVELAEGARIVEVNTATSVVTTDAVFADVVTDGKLVDAFGTAPVEEGACFIAEELIVETSEAPAE